MTTPAQQPAAPAPSAQPPAAVTQGAPAPQTQAPATTQAPSEAASAVAARLRKAERERDEVRKSFETSKGDLELVKRARDPKTRFEALKELGITYEEWTQHTLAGLKDEDPPIKLPADVEAKLAKIDELEGKLTEKDKAEQELRAERDHRDLVDAAKGFIERDAATYPALGALGLSDTLAAEYKTACDAYETEYGEKPSQDEAAKIAAKTAAGIEAKLQETIESNLTAIAKTEFGKKLLAKIVGQPAATTTAANGGTAAPRANGFGNRTLTNNDASSPPAPYDPFKASPAEKKARALEAARRAGH